MTMSGRLLVPLTYCSMAMFFVIPTLAYLGVITNVDTYGWCMMGTLGFFFVMACSVVRAAFIQYVGA